MDFIGDKLIDWIRRSWQNFTDIGLHDDEDLRLGRLFINILTLGVIIVVPLALTIMFLAATGQSDVAETAIAMSMAICFIPISIFCYYQAKRRSVKSAARLYVRLTFIAALVSVFAFDGVRSSAGWILFIWPIMISGILLRPSDSLKMAFLVVVYFLVLFTLSMKGVYEPPLGFKPEGREIESLLFILTFLLLAIGTLTTINMKSLRLATKKMKKAKKTLEKEHAMLEHKVELRNQELWDEIVRRKHAEKEKDETQKQSFLMSKLASIGELASGVAHEINNPLAMIYGYLDLVKSDIESNPLKTHKHLDGISRAVERISKIVDGLRTYARTDTDSIESIDIHQTINDTISIVGTIYASDGIKMTKDFQAYNCFVEGNISKIQQVILSLLSNARDAVLKSEGEISIRTYNEASNKNKNEKIFLEISDNGCGISKELLDKVYDPFHTTKDPDKGTGLGLSMSHSIVYSLHGSININSEEGKGTTVTISLPTMKSTEVFTVDEFSEIIQFNDGNKVLLIDDEVDVRAMLVHHIEALGLEVDVVDNGDDALDLIKENDYEYVIADGRSEALSGEHLYETAEKTQGKGTKIIIITGESIDTLSKLKKKFMLEKADGFIKKPFTKEDFFKVLKQVA